MCPPLKRPRRAETSSEEDEDDDVEMLVGMGFPEAEAMEALETNGHDFERALEKLESMRDESTKAETKAETGSPGAVDYSALRHVEEERKCEEASRRMRTELRGLSASEDKSPGPERGSDVNDDEVDDVIVYDGIMYIVESLKGPDGKNMIRMAPSWQGATQLPLEKLPICGYRNPDQSMVVDPMDEWKLELYHASVLPQHQQGSAESSDEKNEGIVPTTTSTTNCTKPVVVPNFVDATLVEQASQALDALDEAGKMTFKEAYTSSTAEKKRDDKIAFLRFAEINGGRVGFKNKDVVSVSSRNTLSTLAFKLAQYAGELFPERRLLVPEKFMVTIYDGQGARYVAHRDNEYRKENGSWINYRSVSCILYLTKDDIEGGRLRIFHDDEKGDEKRDEQTPQVECISPKGGTAVFFDSKTVKHEVLPCYGRRRALTFWLLEPL